MSAPVPIAFCITDLDPGGAERAMVRIATGLDRSVWAPAVYCLGGGGRLVELLEAAGIPTQCLGVRSRADFGVVLRLRRALRRQRPAILQTFLFHANLAGRIAGRWAGVSRIVSGIRVAERRGRMRLWLDRWTDRLVDRHVCVSSAVAEFSIAAGLPRRKVVVIPNGVDADEIAAAPVVDLTSLGIPRGARTIVSVARLDVQKGLDVLIDAYSDIVPAFPDVHLLLVGEGPARPALEYQAAAVTGTTRMDHPESRSVSYGKIHFAGWRGDSPSLVKASDVFVLPSRWEGMSNAVLEAMAAGCPVVCTDVEGMRDLVTHEQTGWLVRRESGDDLAAGIQQILQNPQLGRDIAIRAQRHVIEEFTWQRVVAMYDQLYRELVGLSPR